MSLILRRKTYRQNKKAGCFGCSESTAAPPYTHRPLPLKSSTAERICASCDILDLWYRLIVWTGLPGSPFDSLRGLTSPTLGRVPCRFWSIWNIYFSRVVLTLSSQTYTRFFSVVRGICKWQNVREIFSCISVLEFSLGEFKCDCSLLFPWFWILLFSNPQKEKFDLIWTRAQSCPTVSFQWTDENCLSVLPNEDVF